MSGAKNAERPSFLAIAALTGGLVWVSTQLGPPVAGGEIRYWAVLMMFLAGVGCLSIVVRSLEALAALLEWLSARQPTGKEGTSFWGHYRQLKAELPQKSAGPFWGALVDRPQKGLFIDFVSNAYVVGPAGSGKTHTAVVTMILSILESKIVTDFKPELLCICKQALEAMGQRVISLNPFGMYEHIVGKTASLNPMGILVDCLFTPGGLRDFLAYVLELTLQLYPEPAESSGDDKFWRAGTRKLIGFVVSIECMINVYDATLADVSRLIEDRQAFEDNLRLIVGVDLEGKPLPDGPLPFEASDWAQYHDPEELAEFLKTILARGAGFLKQMSGADTRTYDSFAEGAEQALELFSFGRLSSALGRSSFDFDEIKNGKTPLNVFLVGDASRTEATEKYFGLMQWYMQLKLKRHPRKDVPVYLINDEASNFSVHGLVSLMTWGRGFGIRIIQYFQNFSAYAAKHGQHAVEVLDSESEIKLFMPGQRAPSTLKKIVELVGKQSIMEARVSADQGRGGLNESMSESGRPLITEDEVRRSPYGILIVRQQLPFLQQPISYSEVHPWRDMVDINPHHGKPFRKKVKLHV